MKVLNDMNTVIEGNREVLGYRQLTGLSVAQSCPLSQGKAVLFCPETKGIRYRLDGVDPTSNIGFPVAVGESVWFVGDDLTQLRFIETEASATLNVTVFL